ncbi:hypothetical protein KC992_04320 [Candidatus Saccharibacteria bacterium]|nr:hypothetical protein [Candidatus Saccharibacteria bacterium]MCA9328571.1 hypothetical protein [Candidatus Saccharibacteria bacterium]
MNPNQSLPPTMPSPKNLQLPKQSHTSLIVALLMSILFVCALGFGIWAFIGMQENKTNLDAKIEAAADVAVKNAEQAKEAEFAEREKDPFKTYTGSATYGSLTFEYPRTWSVYTEEKDSGTLLDFYAHPNVVNGTDKSISSAFRVQILSSDYATEAEKVQKSGEKGEVSITAFRPEKTPSALGLKATGAIIKDKQGVMVLLPQRDKTLKIWTESADYVNDFERVIKTLFFVP